MPSLAAIAAAVTARKKSNMESDSICWQQTVAISSVVMLSWLLISICTTTDAINNGNAGNALYRCTHAAGDGDAPACPATCCIILQGVLTRPGRKGSLVIGMCSATYFSQNPAEANGLLHCLLSFHALSSGGQQTHLYLGLTDSSSCSSERETGC